MKNNYLKQVEAQLELIAQDPSLQIKFDLQGMYMIADAILFQIILLNDDIKLTISRAEADELLIYRQDTNGSFYNIVIDTDGDLEFNILSSKAGLKEYKTPFDLYLNNELNFDLYAKIAKQFTTEYDGTNYYN